MKSDRFDSGRRVHYCPAGRFQAEYAARKAPLTVHRMGEPPTTRRIQVEQPNRTQTLASLSLWESEARVWGGKVVRFSRYSEPLDIQANPSQLGVLDQPGLCRLRRRL